MYLSGDFVDYFPIDDRHIGFYMADVSGHGAASAFVTVMLNTLMIQYRDALWQSEDDTILHPERTLQRLNRDLCRQNLEKHLTLFYGIIDLEQNTMRYSNGGQFPYPLQYDGHEVRTLECRGRPLGLFEDAEFKVWQCDLPQECVLVLVSDGILELMPEEAMLKRYSTLLPAMHGTDLDLDEITDLSLNIQAKLLRVIEEGEFFRLGGTQPINVKVRLLSATNRDTRSCVQNGSFREDLFYRLSVISMKIPPLRERRDDIPLLAKHFLKKYAHKYGKEIQDVDLQAKGLLLAYEWPGNVLTFPP